MSFLFCPICKSKNIIRNYVYNSIYGSIPERPKDFCKSCGYKSLNEFYVTNFVNERDSKIKKILKDKDGI